MKIPNYPWMGEKIRLYIISAVCAFAVFLICGSRAYYLLNYPYPDLEDFKWAIQLELAQSK